MKENIQRFVLLNPPWVVFMIALFMMAIGIFTLGITLKRNYSSQLSNSVHFCPEQNAEDKSLQFAEKLLNITFPVEVSFPSNTFSIIEKKARFLRGMLYDGQLGLHGKSKVSNWPFLVPLTNNFTCKSNEECIDENVSIMTCAILYGIEEHLPNIKDNSLTTCHTNVTQWRKPSAVIKLISSNKQQCKQPLALKYERHSQYAVIPMAHDTDAARLHLLCTSSFLFAIVMLMLCVATWRKPAKLPKDFLKGPAYKEVHSHSFDKDQRGKLFEQVH